MRGPANYKVVQNEKKNAKVPLKLPWAPEPEVDATPTSAGFTKTFLGVHSPVSGSGNRRYKSGAVTSSLPSRKPPSG